MYICLKKHSEEVELKVYNNDTMINGTSLREDSRVPQEDGGIIMMRETL